MQFVSEELKECGKNRSWPLIMYAPTSDMVGWRNQTKPFLCITRWTRHAKISNACYSSEQPPAKWATHELAPCSAGNSVLCYCRETGTPYRNLRLPTEVDEWHLFLKDERKVSNVIIVISAEIHNTEDPFAGKDHMSGRLISRSFGRINTLPSAGLRSLWEKHA
jgi:hypothetical protein